VVNKIKEYQGQGRDIVLNTAAPLFYVKEYAKFFNFTHVIGTQNVDRGIWAENFGEQKLANLNCIYNKNYSLESVITDHSDDLPLMKHAKAVFLVCPNESTLLRLNGIIDYQLL
jgi:phosphoserine phosphatase